MEKQAKMTSCKHCGAEITANAKLCPKCGGKNKKAIYKRPWFILLVVVIAIGAIGSLGGADAPASTNSVARPAASSSASAASTAQTVTYTPYDVSTLMDDLHTNALKASDQYKNQYVELIGRLDVIDSSGAYISLTPAKDSYAILGVQCFIKNDTQKSMVMDLSIGDTLVVRGKITSVGEVLGYSLDIDEISK